MTFIRVALLPLSFTLFAGVAAAQAQPGRGDPQDAAAPVPALPYASPFSTYRPHAVQEVLPWPESNEAARRAGGWRAYAREGQKPSTGAEPAAGAPQHDDHHRHGGTP